MGFLTIKQYGNTIAMMEAESLQWAKKYVESDNVLSGQIGVYSTFNLVGVENTVTIVKH